jgi:hypothetical protein
MSNNCSAKYSVTGLPGCQTNVYREGGICFFRSDSLLKDAKQWHLRRKRRFADLVEEDGAAARLFE